jgi:RNA recognition motif-containing protein
MKLRFTANSSASLKPVEENADTYIPTTTISITYKNAKESGRASLDEVNLMTQWRKNRLLSGVGLDENTPNDAKSKLFVYQLDAPIIGKRCIEDVKNIQIKITRRK